MVPTVLYRLPYRQRQITPRPHDMLHPTSASPCLLSVYLYLSWRRRHLYDVERPEITSHNVSAYLRYIMHICTISKCNNFNNNSECNWNCNKTMTFVMFIGLQVFSTINNNINKRREVKTSEMSQTGVVISDTSWRRLNYLTSWLVHKNIIYTWKISNIPINIWFYSHLLH